VNLIKVTRTSALTDVIHVCITDRWGSACIFRTAVYQSNQIMWLDMTGLIWNLFPLASGKKRIYIYWIFFFLNFTFYLVRLSSIQAFLMANPHIPIKLHHPCWFVGPGFVIPSSIQWPSPTQPTSVPWLNNHCCYSVLYITQLKNCPNVMSIK